MFIGVGDHNDRECFPGQNDACHIAALYEVVLSRQPALSRTLVGLADAPVTHVARMTGVPK
jgi:hypothetical protein